MPMTAVHWIVSQLSFRPDGWRGGRLSVEPEGAERSGKMTQLASAMAVLELTALGTVVIVPLLGVADVDAADEGLLISKRLAAQRTDQAQGRFVGGCCRMPIVRLYEYRPAWSRRRPYQRRVLSRG